MSCKICGGKSGIYPLCPDCFKLRDSGKIEKCEECGEWHYTNESCKCKRKTVVKDITKEFSTSDLTCIICGEISNGKHFCYDCYKKYKDRAIDIRISNCKDVEILDAYGTLQYKCEDGRKVRSKSEKIISDFLFKYGIRTIYEKAVYYYPNENETITLHPDFYLPDHDCYIEHNGVDTKSYKANKTKTEEMYKSLGYRVIVTTEADLGDIEAKLKPVLRIN